MKREEKLTQLALGAEALEGGGWILVTVKKYERSIFVSRVPCPYKLTTVVMLILTHRIPHLVSHILAPRATSNTVGRGLACVC